MNSKLHYDNIADSFMVMIFSKSKTTNKKQKKKPNLFNFQFSVV